MFTDCSCLGCEQTHLHVTDCNETYNVLILNHLSIRVPNFKEKFILHLMFLFTEVAGMVWPKRGRKMAEDHNKIRPVTSSLARLGAAVVISLLAYTVK